MDYLISKQLKACFGALVNRFDGTANALVSPYLNTMNVQGDTLFEVWNHGYDHEYPEFSGTNYVNQKSHFDQSTQKINLYLHTDA